MGPGEGAAEMLCGARVVRRETLSPGETGSIFTIEGKNNNSLGTVYGNSCQVVQYAGSLEVADNLPTLMPMRRCIMTPTPRPDPHLENVLRRMPDAPAARKKVTSRPGWYRANVEVTRRVQWVAEL